MKLAIVAGARPNFLKIAPIVRAIDVFNQSGNDKIFYDIVHTGQHYDDALSSLFFRELGIPKPKINFKVGSGTHAYQTGHIMMAFEEYCFRTKPNMVMVVGDVNSTIACAIAAVKLRIPVAHVEAGLRSYDLSVPEEVNRVVTDRISQLLFAPETIARNNLIREGIDREKIFVPGDVMIDSLHYELNRIDAEADAANSDKIVLATIHRPFNTDSKENLSGVLKALSKIAEYEERVLFPMHPRTRAKITEFNLWDKLKGVEVLSPCGYSQFVRFLKRAVAVITDSGGIQTEATVMQIPCITLLSSSGKPIHPYTLTIGCNVIVLPATNSTDYCDKIAAAFELAMGWKPRKGGKEKHVSPEWSWDGNAAKRIVDVLGGL